MAIVGYETTQPLELGLKSSRSHSPNSGRTLNGALWLLRSNRTNLPQPWLLMTIAIKVSPTQDCNCSNKYRKYVFNRELEAVISAQLCELFDNTDEDVSCWSGISDIGWDVPFWHFLLDPWCARLRWFELTLANLIQICSSFLVGWLLVVFNRRFPHLRTSWWENMSEASSRENQYHSGRTYLLMRLDGKYWIDTSWELSRYY